ncbi:MAG: glycosyltransferase family 4 protein [Deltaproteobacteria bacterium]
MDKKSDYKIVFCLQSGNITTGAPKSLHHYLKYTGLSKDNFIVLMPFKGENAEAFISDLAGMGIRTEIINKGLDFMPFEEYLRNPTAVLNKIFTLSIYIYKLALFILKEKPQALYINGSRGNTESLIGRLLGCRVIWQVRGLEELSRFNLSAKKTLKIKVKLFRVKLHNICAKAIIAVSKSEENVLKGVLGKKIKNIFVVPNGIEEELLQKQLEVKKSCNPDGRMRIVCLMSTICSTKGIYDVLDVVRILKTKGIKLICSIYGRFGKLADSEEKIKEYSLDLIEDGYIRFCGYTNDAVKALSENDIFLYPSYFEGFPRAVLEAMASRVVIVASGIDGILDQVKDMESAILFQPGDIDAITNGIEKVINDEILKDKLINNAYERVKKNFMIKDVSARIDRIIIDNLMT